MKFTKYIYVVFILVLSLAFVQTAGASSTCNFIRFLDLGDEGEDVRCLQKYLNENGFKISEGGAGSPGNETTRLGGLTKEALIKWQTENGLLPATGYFGPGSTALYKKLTKIDSVVTSPVIIPPGIITKTQTTKTAEAALIKASEAIADAIDEIDDSNVAANKIEDAREELTDAQLGFIKAVKSYIAGDFTRAKSFADTSYEDAQEAYKDAGGKTDEDEIDELINEIDDEIDVVKAKIKTADKDGDDVDESENLIDEAENLLKKAETALDDGDSDKAEDYARDAREKAEDAEDEIGDSSNEKEDAEEAIADAKAAIRDAKVAIQDARDEGDDTDDAEKLLDGAEDYYDDARERFDDKDYDEAQDLAEKAEQKAEDSEDEL